MKYATFKDFVREAYYHGVDYMQLDVDFNTAGAATEPNDWRGLVHYYVTRKEFPSEEKFLAGTCNSIVIPGVMTFLPDEVAMKEAYAKNSDH